MIDDESSLAGSLRAVAPDVTRDEDDRLRKELVRRRLLGTGMQAIRLGRFMVLGQIGSGAMSAVYAAYDEELDRKIAVKVLRAPVTASLGDQRLRREAQAMARLSHPNVAAVHEIGSWEGRMFIAMEFIKGETVEAWLRTGQRDWKAILDVYLEAGRGLAAAHGLGLVHRDFKPTNMMVGEDGRTRVLDFGLVRLAEEGEAGEAGEAERSERRDAPMIDPALALTATGDCLGTVAYMAPEQRARPTAADARSDQFSFCMSLHEALFGVRPASGTPAARSPQVPARLSAALERGLSARPDHRWPSMDHLLRELANLRWPARRWRPHRTALAMALVVAAVVLAARHLVMQEQTARAALENQAASERTRVRDATLVTAAQQLVSRDPTAAAAALREVERPAEAVGWRSTATAALFSPLSAAVDRELESDCDRVEYSRDGGRVLVVFRNAAGVRVRRADNLAAVASVTDMGRMRGLSPDHRWVITQTKTADPVLTRTDGQRSRTVHGLGEVTSYAITNDDDPDVIAMSPAGEIRRWHVGEVQVIGRPPRNLVDHGVRGWTFGLGPLGLHAMAVSPKGEHWVWDLRTDGPAVRISDPVSGRRLRFSEDERWLTVTSSTGDVLLWDSQSARPPRVLRGHTKPVYSTAFSHDGRWLVTVSYDTTARVWPTDGSAEPQILRGHTSAVTSAHFDRTGRRVVTASYDRTARVWNLDGTGDVMVLRGHMHQMIGAVFSPDGEHVVTCGLDPAVRLWNVSVPPVRVIGRHAAEIWSASLDPAGQRLATAAFDGTAAIWQLDGSRPGIVLRGHTSQQVYSAVFSPDGTRVATGANDGTARIWSADGTGEPRVLSGHFGWVYGLSFSADGRWLATGSKKGEVRVSAVDGDAPPRTLIPDCAGLDRGWIESVSFGPRGDWVVSNGYGCERGAAVMQTHGSGAPRALGPPRFGAVIAVSPDGRIVTAERDGMLRIWRAGDADPVATLRTHGPSTHDLSFSADGKRMVSSSFDGTAQIWDLEHPGEPLTLLGHEDWVVKAGFDRAGERVVTASYDGTARVWQLDDPRQPIVLRGHEGKLRYAGFTPDGRVVTASIDGTVRLWSLDTVATDAATLMAQLRAATTMCLSADQRVQYLDEDSVVATHHYAACERAAGRIPAASRGER